MDKPNDKAAQLVAETITATIKTIPKEHLRDFIEITVCAYIALMRGGAGDEYVRGFLTGALEDLGKPSVTYTMPEVH